MREKVKDRGRLEHILQACNILLENKAKYSREMVINDPISLLWFSETCRDYR